MNPLPVPRYSPACVPWSPLWNETLSTLILECGTKCKSTDMLETRMTDIPKDFADIEAGVISLRKEFDALRKDSDALTEKIDALYFQIV